MREPSNERTVEALAEEQSRIKSVATWTECSVLGCPTRCFGSHCDDHEVSDASGSGTDLDLGGIQTTPDMSIVDDLVDGEPEHTSVIHRVDDVRIVRLDDAIGANYRIEEREHGRWEAQTEVTREQALLVAGMVNKRWTEG